MEQDGRGDVHPTFEIRITPRGTEVRFRVSATFEGIRDAVAALGQRSDFRPEAPTIWDFSETRSPEPVGADDMRRLAPVVAPLREGAGHPRVAIVTPHDAAFAGARMFGGINDSKLHVDLAVFRCREEAEAWAYADAHVDDPEGEVDGGGSGSASEEL